MHIILKDGESVTIQRPGRSAVVEVTATGVHNPSGLSVGRRPVSSPQEKRAAGIVDRRYTDPAYVRVDIKGSTYCYLNPDGAARGDTVVVVLPNGEARALTVLGNGRGEYTGNVYKTARKVELPA